MAALILLCSTAALPAKKEKRGDSTRYSMIAGTVYRPPGFAAPGAEVVVTPDRTQVDNIKLKKAELFTDARGEWTLRVPPVPAKWRIDVKLLGYRPEQRSISIEGEQRVDLSIVLETQTEEPTR